MSDATESDKLKMRTAIYVDEPITLTIRANDDCDRNALLLRYNRYNRFPPEPAIGTHRLQPGIYMVLSSTQLDISNPSMTTHFLTGDKDVPPDPKASVLASAGATPADIRKFFELAKGMDD